MSWKDDVRSRFSPDEDSDKWNRMYDQATECLEDEFFRQRRDFTIGFIEAHYDATSTICDLGCGAGPVVSELLRRGYDAVGFDYSADMLQNAARRIERLAPGRRPLARGDVQQLPLRDESFACVVCLGVISYVEHYENIIREIRRVLRPGGHAIISYRNETNPMVSDPVGPFRYLAKKTIRALGLGSRTFTIGQAMSFREVREVLARNGLALEAFKGIGFGPLRFNTRPLLSEARSLKVHDAVARVTDRLGSEAVVRLGADVHILVVRKPASGA